MYSDYAEGGLRVPNIDIKFKSLKLAWIARLFSNQPGLESWRVIPDHYFSKFGGPIFLLRCNYDEKCLDQSGMPSFYKQILLFFKDLRVLFNQDTGQNMILFNNKEILIYGKTVCYNKWLERNVIAVHDLLGQSTGKFLSYHEFKQYYNLNCNFLTFFQVISAIPKHLLEKAKSSKHLDKGNFDRNNVIFHLSPSMSLNLLKMQSRDYYWLLNRGDTKATGLIKWEKELQLVDFKWENYFNSIKTLCNETKLRDFYYKLLHRIVTTKRVIKHATFVVYLTLLNTPSLIALSQINYTTKSSYGSMKIVPPPSIHHLWKFYLETSNVLARMALKSGN